MKFKKLSSMLLAGVLALGSGFVPEDVEAKAGAKFPVKLVKCTDGDTAEFTVVGKSRFLYVNTPESIGKVEYFGKEASAYTCKRLKTAKKIEAQYDGVKKDKYGRSLVWVWLDEKLFQSELTSLGYVRDFYDYGTYSYESLLQNDLAEAKLLKVGMWAKNAAPVKNTHTTYPVQTQPVVQPQTFKNCTEMRKVYPTGVDTAHVSYEAKHDRDGDGIACEPN